MKDINIFLESPYRFCCKDVPENAILISIPWPPSINRYWRHTGNRVYVTNEGKSYKHKIKLIASMMERKKLEGRIQLSIEAYPPDKRVRDLDNILKVSIDALKECDFFIDDSYIDKILITRMRVEKPGFLDIVIKE